MNSTVKAISTFVAPMQINKIDYTLNCGHHLYGGGYSHVKGLAVGDFVACEQCRNEADGLAWLGALDASTVARVRFSPRFGGWYNFYRRATDSPSGVMLLGAVPATPAIDALLRVKRLSPLSPTEIG